MEIASARQRVILDAILDHSVIRGTLTAPTGERREFHGWLELNTMLEAILGTARPAVRRTTRHTGPAVGSE
jgi:hypothetical protein